jgi:hypothetical protein
MVHGSNAICAMQYQCGFIFAAQMQAIRENAVASTI